MIPLSERVHSVPASPIRKLAPLARAAARRGVRVLHLNIGQPDIKTPTQALSAIHRMEQPILSYIPSAVSPNVSLRLQNYARQVRIDITAPLTAPLTGTLSLDMPSGWSVKLPQDRIDLKPGELWNRVLTIRRPPCPTGRFDLKATFVREGGLPPLVVHQPAVL